MGCTSGCHGCERHSLSSSFITYFLASTMWASFSLCPWMYDALPHQIHRNGTKLPWTEISETMVLNKSFLFKSFFLFLCIFSQAEKLSTALNNYMIWSNISLSFSKGTHECTQTKVCLFLCTKHAHKCSKLNAFVYFFLNVNLK
jgi:hypothetical protein